MRDDLKKVNAEFSQKETINEIIHTTYPCCSYTQLHKKSYYK